MAGSQVAVVIAHGVKVISGVKVGGRRELGHVEVAQGVRDVRVHFGAVLSSLRTDEIIYRK